MPITQYGANISLYFHRHYNYDHRTLRYAHRNPSSISNNVLWMHVMQLFLISNTNLCLHLSPQFTVSISTSFGRTSNQQQDHPSEGGIQHWHVLRNSEYKSWNMSQIKDEPQDFQGLSALCTPNLSIAWWVRQSPKMNTRALSRSPAISIRLTTRPKVDNKTITHQNSGESPAVRDNEPPLQRAL